MTGSDPKANLRQYLQEGRDSLMWKLDGLSDYDLRRPLTLAKDGNLPPGDEAWRAEYRNRLEQAARAAGQG